MSCACQRYNKQRCDDDDDDMSIALEVMKLIFFCFRCIIWLCNLSTRLMCILALVTYLILLKIFAEGHSLTAKQIKCRVWWCSSLVEVEIYARTKFWRDWSIYSGDAHTTSSFWKQTATILDFCFPFLFWPFFRHQHVILRWPTKCYLNRIISVWDMTSYWVSGQQPSAMLDFMMGIFYESPNTLPLYTMRKHDWV